MNSKLSPSELAHKLKAKFNSDSFHQEYLTATGQHLSPLIFKGQKSLIFYPISDQQKQSGIDSINTLMQKCGREFLDFMATNNEVNYLIFPIAHTLSQHWITGIFSIHEKKMIFLDSIPLFKKNCDEFIKSFNKTFFYLNFQCETSEYCNQWQQFNGVDCGYWTLANIEHFDQGGDISQIFASFTSKPISEIHDKEIEEADDDGFIDIKPDAVVNLEAKPYPKDDDAFYQLRFEFIKKMLDDNKFNRQFLLNALISSEILEYNNQSICPSFPGHFSLSEIIDELNKENGLLQLKERENNYLIRNNLTKSLGAIRYSLNACLKHEFTKRYDSQYKALSDWKNIDETEEEQFFGLYKAHREKLDADLSALIASYFPLIETNGPQWHGQDEISLETKLSWIQIDEKSLETKLSWIQILVTQRHWHLLRIAFEIGIAIAALKYTPYLLNLAAIQLPILNHLLPAIIFAICCLDLAYQVIEAKNLAQSPDKFSNSYC